MEKHEIKIPHGCEVDTVTTEGGSVVVTFKQKKISLPETWVEFCENYPVDGGECYITTTSDILQVSSSYGNTRVALRDRDLLPDRATAEAVLALCQLIQLRDCYNHGWQPDWEDNVFTINYSVRVGFGVGYGQGIADILYFKDEETANNFLLNFNSLINKLRPLYGIKEGGEE